MLDEAARQYKLQNNFVFEIAAEDSCTDLQNSPVAGLQPAGSVLTLDARPHGLLLVFFSGVA